MRPGPKTDPTLDPLKRRTVLLDDLNVDRLRAIGGGNLSNGIRLAARAQYLAYQATPDIPTAGCAVPLVPV